ncbi:MAG: hypothetical protein ACR2NO_02445 [Chloroflexota bacterium]
MHPTRRRILPGLIIGWAATLAGCDLGRRPSAAREHAIYEVVGPDAEGKRRRVEAWNRRYGEAAGTLLTHVPPPPAYRHAGRRATARLLLDERAQGTPPGIVWIEHESVPDLARHRAVRGLDDFVRRDRLDLKRFMPCALQPCFGLDDRLVSLPDEVDAGQLYFNRRHVLEAGIDFRRAGLDFERPDSTWENLRRAALDLQLGRRAADQAPWHPGAAGIAVWGWANGGGWVTPDGRRATFARDENVSALAWLVRAAQEAGGPSRVPDVEQLPGPALHGTDADRVAGHPFLDGRLSLWFDSGRFMSTLARMRPDFPIGYVESPRRHARSPLVTWARSSGYALRAGSPDALWPALRFLVGEDAAIVDASAEAAQAPASAASGRPLWFPPFTGQLRADRFLASRYRIDLKIMDEGRDHALEQLRHARPSERCPAPEEIWLLVRAAQRAALRGASARESLEDARRRAQEILDVSWRGTR